jgi:hypothetical protein
MRCAVAASRVIRTLTPLRLSCRETPNSKNLALVQAMRVGHQRGCGEPSSSHRVVGVSMDEDRKIRLLPAPILFVASLLLGGILSGKAVQDFIGSKDGSQLIGIIAAGGVAVFAAGYGIGTCTQVLLRLIFRIRARLWGGSRFHEVALSDESFERVWDQIGAPGKPDRALELYAGAVFDFGILRMHRKGVHEWLFRRWNGFNTAVNSLWPLILSLPIGHWILNIPWSVMWCLPVLMLALALSFVAVWAWRDTMKMAGFMASLKGAPKLGETPDPTDKAD